MKHTNYIAVDLGATSGRVVLSVFDGTKVEMREVARFRNPMIPMNGHLFWNLPALYYEILQGLRKVAAEYVEITSIGIDTWGCDFAFFTADGQLSGLPHCYRDRHTEGAMDKFFESVSPEHLYELTGIQFMNFNSLFQLDTLRRNGCAALETADKILFMPDALSYLLTGNAVTEYTVASTSQMLNPRTGELEPELLEAIGLPRERFGRMVRPGTVVGRLTPQVSEYTGLPDVPVVAVAGHDTASAVAAVPASGTNFAYLSCGTWSLLGIETLTPVITEDSFRKNFTNEGGLDGTTRFLKNICGMWLFERCREEFPDTQCKDVPVLAALCETSDYEGLIDPHGTGGAKGSGRLHTLHLPQPCLALSSGDWMVARDVAFPHRMSARHRRRFAQCLSDAICRGRHGAACSQWSGRGYGFGQYTGTGTGFGRCRHAGRHAPHFGGIRGTETLHPLSVTGVGESIRTFP